MCLGWSCREGDAQLLTPAFSDCFCGTALLSLSPADPQKGLCLPWGKFSPSATELLLEIQICSSSFSQSQSLLYKDEQLCSPQPALKVPSQCPKRASFAGWQRCFAPRQSSASCVLYFESSFEGTTLSPSLEKAFIFSRGAGSQRARSWIWRFTPGHVSHR